MTVQESTSQICCLRDGRRLGYAEFGDPEGFPVIYCHGFPASRLEGGLFEAAARRNGAKVIGVDRPGYGLSDWQARRQLLDWPDDVAQLLNHLGLNRFAVLAVSGGGPYGLALSAKLVGRIAATTLVCPLGPVCRSDLVRAMRWPARLSFISAEHTPWLTKLVCGDLLGPLMGACPSFVLSLLTVAIPPADRAILARKDVNTLICDSIREALKVGTKGALWDFQVYVHPWGFDPGDIAAPIVIWHGEADATVPISHSQTLAGMLANAKLNTLPGEGHFSLPIRQADKIMADLMRALA